VSLKYLVYDASVYCVPAIQSNFATGTSLAGFRQSLPQMSQQIASCAARPSTPES
jgi:hypothetical protein